MKIHAKLILNILLAMSTTAFAICAQANIQLYKPSQAAIEACNGKAAGSECSFSGSMNNTINGTCFNGLHRQGNLACRVVNQAASQAQGGQVPAGGGQ
jgi:hypothetical protein